MDKFSVLVLAVACVLVTVDAGCKEAKLCCSGRDITCKTQGFRIIRENNKNKDNSTLLEKVKTVCYCDEHCDAQGDCCDDYKDSCPSKDCELGEWQEWGECNVRCGQGMRERIRPVITKPQHGGKICDTKLQIGWCEGQKCKTARHSYGFEIKETAKVVPATFGAWRTQKRYNPFKDIRKNLFSHYYSANKIIQRPTYCARFELTRVSRACHSKAAKEWVKNLKAGATVCVECQSFAMKKKLGVRCYGHGVYLQETAWNAIASPGCHGSWVMQSQHEECSCDAESPNSVTLI